MGPIHLFELASSQAHWLEARQAVVAKNISNANTPGYKAFDVAPFDSLLDGAVLALGTSDPRHMKGGSSVEDQISVRDGTAWDVVHSGNSVSLEQELMKASEVNRSYSMNRSIVKAFNQMLFASLKG